MAKATGGFEDDTLVVSGEDRDGAIELTDREKAIASGDDPDQVGAEEAEEEGDEADGTDAEIKEDAASGDEGTEAPGSDWIDSDVKEWADSYGIDEDSLSSFESAADFKRFAAIYEKHLAASEDASGISADSSSKGEQKPAPEKAEAADGMLDEQWFQENGYDEQTVGIVKTVNKANAALKTAMARIEQLEQRIKDGDAQREQESLNREIDALGGRFGSGDSLTRDQIKARAKLADAVEVVKQTLAKRGEKASMAVILRRAELTAFGEEILAEERAKAKDALTQSVKKQSAKRRSVGRNTKPPARRERPGEAEDPVKAIAGAPDIVEFFNENQD